MLNIVLNQNQTPPAATSAPLQPSNWSEVDFRATGFTITSFTEAGTLNHTLEASSLTQRTDGLLTLTDPTFVWERRPTSFWSAKALTGEVNKPNGHVILEHNVILTQHGNGPELNIQSPNMTFWPDDGIAETEADVTINRGTGTITATGFQAEFAPRNIFLNQQVRGIYEPTL